MRELLSIIPGAPTTVRDLLHAAELASLTRTIVGEESFDRPLDHPRIQKSGLALVGHLHGIVPSRVQILGETELSFLEGLPHEERVRGVRAFCSAELSLIVVTRNAAPPAELVDEARRTATPLVVVDVRSSAAITAIHTALDRLLAPREWLHGVVVDVYGVGILLLGPSGIGKSECALFLVERGHRFVADDRVELVRLPDETVRARPAPRLRHHLEIRGLGILNVRDLFGATSVLDETVLKLVIELCRFDALEANDRLGIDDLSRNILGIPVPMVRIPVHPGRDMGVLLEVAARNQLLKDTGHHAARAFLEKLSRG